jgi:hypothetical protein
MGRDTSVGIATRLRAERPRFNSWLRQVISFLHSIQPGSGFHLAFYAITIGGISLEVKQPGREADHLPPFSAEVKHDGAIAPLPDMLSWHTA